MARSGVPALGPVAWGGAVGAIHGWLASNDADNGGLGQQSVYEALLIPGVLASDPRAVGIGYAGIAMAANRIVFGWAQRRHPVPVPAPAPAPTPTPLAVAGYR